MKIGIERPALLLRFLSFVLSAMFLLFMNGRIVAAAELPAQKAEETDGSLRMPPEDNYGICPEGQQDTEGRDGAPADKAPAEEDPAADALSAEESECMAALEALQTEEAAAESDGTVALEILEKERDSAESDGTVEYEIVLVEHAPKQMCYYAGYYREDLKNSFSMNFPRELQEYTYEMAEKYRVSYEIMLGLFGVESGWNPTLYNYNGTCFGLGMLNVFYCREYYARQGIDIMTAKGNIEAACSTLADKLREFDGNLVHALMAYNAGSGGARQMIAAGIESTGYSKGILSYAENLIPEAEWLEMQK